MQFLSTSKCNTKINWIDWRKTQKLLSCNFSFLFFFSLRKSNTKFQNEIEIMKQETNMDIFRSIQHYTFVICTVNARKGQIVGISAAVFHFELQCKRESIELCAAFCKRWIRMHWYWCEWDNSRFLITFISIRQQHKHTRETTTKTFEGIHGKNENEEKRRNTKAHNECISRSSKWKKKRKEKKWLPYFFFFTSLYISTLFPSFFTDIFTRSFSPVQFLLGLFSFWHRR